MRKSPFIQDWFLRGTVAGKPHISWENMGKGKSPVIQDRFLRKRWDMLQEHPEHPHISEEIDGFRLRFSQQNRSIET